MCVFDAFRSRTCQRKNREDCNYQDSHHIEVTFNHCARQARHTPENFCFLKNSKQYRFMHLYWFVQTISAIRIYSVIAWISSFMHLNSCYSADSWHMMKEMTFITLFYLIKMTFVYFACFWCSHIEKLGFSLRHTRRMYECMITTVYMCVHPTRTPSHICTSWCTSVRLLASVM